MQKLTPEFRQRTKILFLLNVTGDTTLILDYGAVYIDFVGLISDMHKY